MEKEKESLKRNHSKHKTGDYQKHHPKYIPNPMQIVKEKRKEKQMDVMKDYFSRNGHSIVQSPTSRTKRQIDIRIDKGRKQMNDEMEDRSYRKSCKTQERM